MYSGVYVGENTELLGKTATIYEDPITSSGGRFGMLLAQFDDLALPMNYTHSWMLAEREDFVILASPTWKDDEKVSV